jgi:hypothetical protein
MKPSSERWVEPPSNPMEHDMRASNTRHTQNPRLLGESRLNLTRMRRPKQLPTVISTTSVGRYLDRLRWLFGG